MELHLKKNSASELMFPMVDKVTPELLKTGETVTDTAYYKDGAGAWTALAITDTATEIGTTGMYTLALTAAEKNHDLIMVKLTAANSADSVIIIRTFARNIDDAAFPTVSGRSLDVSATGEAGLDFDNFKAASVAKTLTNITVPVVTTLTGHTPQTADHTAGIAAIPTVMRGTDGAALAVDYTAARAAKLDNLDGAITSRQPSGNVTVGGYAAGQAPADGVLATPANKLATDGTGKVTVGTNSDKTGYDLNADQSAVTVGTVTSNTDMRGTEGAATAAALAAHDGNLSVVAGYVDTEVAAIKAKTDNLPADPASETNVNANETKIDNLTANVAALNDFDPATQTVDVGKMAGSATAATNIKDSAERIVTGATVAGTLSVTEMTTDLTETTNDHYKGRVIVWDDGPLKDAATDVTAYNGTTKKLTFTAVTDVPVAGNKFRLI